MPEATPERLIIRYLSHEATPEEENQLLEWVSASSKNQKHFQEYVKIWDKKPETRLFNTVDALQKLNERIDASESVALPEENNLKLGLKLAATLLILVAASYSIVSLLKKDREPVAYQTVIVKKGEKKSLTLSDGSVIQLNSNSSLKFPESFSEIREVFLDGEAFFNIQENPDKPFIVRTGELSTQVLGTSFNIKVASEMISVSVATGRVKVYNQESEAELLPAQSAKYSLASKHIEKSSVELDDELAWTRNTVVFKDTPITDAAKTLEDWYDIHIQLTDPDIGKCPITGTFKNESLQHILDAIEYSTGIEHEINNKEVILSGIGCQ